jgi:hypothetical protein
MVAADLVENLNFFSLRFFVPTFVLLAVPLSGLLHFAYKQTWGTKVNKSN